MKEFIKECLDLMQAEKLLDHPLKKYKLSIYNCLEDNFLQKFYLERTLHTYIIVEILNKKGEIKMADKNTTATKMVKENLEEVESKFDNTKEKVSNNLSNIAAKIHEKSDVTQEFLSDKVETAEEILSKKAHSAGEYTQQTLAKANDLGHRAGEVLENSSEYIKNFDMEEAKESVKTTLRERPEIGIALAGTFGLLLGIIIGSRRNNS